jgi:hypothetical protein
VEVSIIYVSSRLPRSVKSQAASKHLECYLFASISHEMRAVCITETSPPFPHLVHPIPSWSAQSRINLP